MFLQSRTNRSPLILQQSLHNAQGLENGWGTDSDDEDDSLLNSTWIPESAHGLEGLKSSAVFKYLQHDGKLRFKGAEGGVHVISEIPHLESLSHDNDSWVTILFRNGDLYKVPSEHAENIQTMTSNVYSLKPVEGGCLSVELYVPSEALNEPFIAATKQVNQLLKTIRDVLGSHSSTRSILHRMGLNL